MSQIQAVIIRRKWVEAAKLSDGVHHLPAAIVDFVNDFQKVGVYARHETPASAMWVYHTDYYLAQVNNGGHSQFIRNSHAAWVATVEDALAGLAAIGATTQLQILREMNAWCDANPEEAGRQTGFDVRAPFLDTLDKRFYEAEKTTPITPLLAQWILTWPNLQVVDDDRYPALIAEMGAANPLRESRLLWRTTSDIQFQLKAAEFLAIGAACGAVRPIPEAKCELRAGGYRDINGRQRMAFGVATEAGHRLCTVDDSVELYEYVENSQLPKLGPTSTSTS